MRGLTLVASLHQNLDGAELTDHAALKAAGAVAITDNRYG